MGCRAKGGDMFHEATGYAAVQASLPQPVMTEAICCPGRLSCPGQEMAPGRLS